MLKKFNRAVLNCAAVAFFVLASASFAGNFGWGNADDGMPERPGVP